MWSIIYNFLNKKYNAFLMNYYKEEMRTYLSKNKVQVDFSTLYIPITALIYTGGDK